MTKKSYTELLRDPRWQKKRLEILQRDGFTCRICEATEKTLHVHHCYYSRHYLPWEYENESLVTLCHECHDFESEVKEDKTALCDALSRHGAMTSEFNRLACTIYSFPPQAPIGEVVGAMEWAWRNPAIQQLLLEMKARYGAWVEESDLPVEIKEQPAAGGV